MEELEIDGKFLSAEELGLSEIQRCALLKTLAHLEHGKLDGGNWKDRTRPSYFDMQMWGGECGTVCCIGGSAEALIGSRHVFWQHRNSNAPTDLYRLFYPSADPKHPAWSSSPSQAAVALRGYLETGKADWNAAMKTPKYQKQRRKDY